LFDGARDGCVSGRYLNLDRGMAFRKIDLLNDAEGDDVPAEARILYLLEEGTDVFFVHELKRF